MKIIDGLKLKGCPAEIPGTSRDDLPHFFLDLGLITGAEIGVYKGNFTEKLSRVGLKVYAIDPWSTYKDYQPNRANFQKRQEVLYIQTKKSLARYPNCSIIRKLSMDALQDFDNNSLDFVHIDGNHQFSYVAEDISEWSKKIKTGGVVSGRCYLGLPSTAKHDKVCQSKYVVDAYTKAFNISNWYLFGRLDGWLGWFWIKK